MELEENLRNSIDYTVKLAEDFGRLLLLIVLSIIPIVNLVVVGYFSQVVEGSPGRKVPPPLKDFGETWFQGLRVALAAILYLIIPIIIFGLGWLTVWDARQWMSPMFVPHMFFLRLGLFAAIGAIVAFFISLLMVIGIVHMIKTDNFGNAFDFPKILKIIATIGYGKYFLWLVIIFLAALIVAAISSVPAIGWLISLALSPLYGVFASRSVSQIYADGS